MSEDNEQSPRSQELPTLGSLLTCPDCFVAVGTAHISYDYDGCDVARCLVTGRQRLSCEADHDCGLGRVERVVAGRLDCQYLGWMLGPGLPDVNRLYSEAVWDPRALLVGQAHVTRVFPCRVEISATSAPLHGSLVCLLRRCTRRTPPAASTLASNDVDFSGTPD